MAWGFAQLEGCILIYSNWNGKTKVTRTLTFFLGYSQAGREQAMGTALPQVRPLLTPSQAQRGKSRRGEGSML